uniref:Uncharacterized protein n=1 Tax=Acrobeloides nanus TaxID=290746 RepID=A0A914C889_9BILA
MRWKVYSEQGKFTKNDQALAIQFFILCGFQYLLSNLEHYLKETPDNYIGILLLSVPILDQILNALVLLLTNTDIRRAYSPDLAPSDYHLSRDLQANLDEMHFEKDEDAKKWLRTYFDQKPRIFFDRGIRSLLTKWAQVILNHGEYLT